MSALSLAANQPRLLVPMVPAVAVLLLTGSLLLIAWELNRPGSILPGALGVLGCMFAIAALARYPINPAALCLMLACAVVLGGNLAWRVPLYALFGATVGLIASLHALVVGAGEVPWTGAVICGAVLGGAASLLSRIALRARRAKQVN